MISWSFLQHIVNLGGEEGEKKKVHTVPLVYKTILESTLLDVPTEHCTLFNLLDRYVNI